VIGGKISGFVRRRLHRIVFLVVYVAFVVDDETVAVAVAVVQPVSLFEVPRISDG
jgi:hypothetical protein